MIENNHLDINLLQSYLNTLGGAVVKKMLDLYIQQSTLYLEAISLAVEQRSESNWQESCHKMKGAAGSVGLLQVHKKSASLEKSTEDWLIKEEAVETLTEINNQAEIAFNKWLDLKPQ